MIYLYYSNHLEALLPPLEHYVTEGDPFHPKSVVVPNRGLQTWLNLELAQRLGIAANLRYSWLDRAMLEVLGRSDTRPLSDNMVQMMIIERLKAYLKVEDPDLAPLRAYLNAGGQLADRLFQLSRKLVALFREYGLSRKAMTRAWEGDGWFVAPNHPIEAWQRRLWLDLFGEKGCLAERNRLPDRKQLGAPGIWIRDTQEPQFQALHLFGLSYISKFHQEWLAWLGGYGDVFLYVLNPCRAFWEDIWTSAEERFLRKRLELGIPETAKGQGELENFPEDNPFLQAWGKPGREYFRLLNEVGDWDFRDLFVEPPLEPTTLLQRIQADILDRRPPPESPPFAATDASLRVLGCASPRREAEIVANAIWDLLREDDALSPRDIGVIVSDMETYQAEIESAFQRIHGLPFNLIDGRSGRASRLVEAVIFLMELCKGHFQREAVFKLYRHPNFQAKFPKADVSVWLRMADDLCIFYGKDKQDQQDQGLAYFDRDLYNWDQAFKRLLLGAYLHHEASVFHRESQVYRQYSLSESEAENARLFMTVTQSLFGDTYRLNARNWSAGQWARYLREMIETYLAPGPGESADFDRILGIAGGMESLAEGIEDADRPLDFDLVRSFFLAELDQLRPYYGQYLAEGITVSSFAPMRPIPFKIMFVMGLDETRFPTPRPRDTLDLRWTPRRVTLPNGEHIVKTREIGDVTLRERDRYMFLETLMATRQRLILSFVDRNERTDDPINPSSVVAELHYWLRHYCRNFEIETHPLKGYSEAYFSGSGQPANHDPAALRQALARRSRTSLRAAMDGAPITAATIEKLHSNLGPRALSSLGLQRPEPSVDEGEQPIIRMTFDQLRKFLECPLQATATRVLHLRDRDEVLEEKNDEPFAVGHLERWCLLEDVWETVLADHQGDFQTIMGLEDVLDRAATVAELEGRLPAGPLLPVARDELADVLRNWTHGLEELGLAGQAARYAIGRGSGPRCLEPVQLEIPHGDGHQQVELLGKTQYLFSGEEGFHTVSFMGKTLPKEKKWNKYHLRGFMDALALAANGFTDSLHVSIVGADSSPPIRIHHQFSRERARAYLQDLVQDMIGEVHDYLLPADIVWDLAHLKHPDDWERQYLAKLEHLKDTSHVSSPTAYGPIHEWRQYPPTPHVRRLIQKRFGLFFQSFGLRWAMEIEGVS